MILLNGKEIKPTIFPDGTSQVWKLDEIPVKADITWKYKQEVELIWVNQLICLLYQSGSSIESLYIPYGRQDKVVSNETTFAKEVFLEILLKEHVKELVTLDAHSHDDRIVSLPAHSNIYWAIVNDLFSNLVLVFPDKGARDRYGHEFDSNHYIVLDKVRNQLTGKIESLVLDKTLITPTHEANDLVKMSKTRFLIIDDISDYGVTFKMAAKALRDAFGNDITVQLYVTHYLGHGGNKQLEDAGISKVYTTDSLNEYRKFRKFVNDASDNDFLVIIQ